MNTLIQPEPARATRAALASLSLCVMLAALGTSIVNVALPTLAASFAAPFAHVQWVVLAYLLAITTTVVAAGRLGDALGRRRLLVAGIALFTLASLACAAAPTLKALIAARAAQGMGAAMMMALALAFVADTVPKAQVGRTMGLLGTMSAVGTALGPAVGGALTAWLGWRVLFVVGVPLALVALILAARTLPTARAPAGRRSFDGVGAVLLAGALGAYSMATTVASGGLGLANALWLAVSVLLAALLVHVERRVGTPLLRLAVLREPVLRTGVVGSVLVTTVVMATLVVGPFYLAGALALDAARIGAAMATGPVVAALAGVPAGRVADRIGSGPATLGGLATMIGGAALLAVLPARFGVIGYAGALAVLTAGYAMFQAANNTAVMAQASADERGVIAGLLNLARNVGLVTGASVMGAVFVTAIGGDVATAPPDAIARGMHRTFGVAALLLVMAFIVVRTGVGHAMRSMSVCTACGDTDAH